MQCIWGHHFIGGDGCIADEQGTKSERVVRFARNAPSRLALAQTNLDDSLRLESAMQARANDRRWKQQMALLSTRKNLQDAVQEAHDRVKKNTRNFETANAPDPADRLRFLNSELADERVKKLEVQNSLKAAEENIRRLEQRLADMQQQIKAKLNDLQRPLRLPMEHETDKSVVYVIVRYGHIYPCRNLSFESERY